VVSDLREIRQSARKISGSAKAGPGVDNPAFDQSRREAAVNPGAEVAEVMPAKRASP
jgi:hypothetical protein